MNLAQANSVVPVIVCAVTERYRTRAVNRVCRIVEEEGGQFSGLVARTARYKAQSALDESDARAVITYHSIIAARAWAGPADDALEQCAHRVRKAVGTLLEDHAVAQALKLLCELAGVCPKALPAEVAERIRKRLGLE